MATDMQPKELGIKYLFLCENKESQKVSSTSKTACQTWVGGYRKMLLTSMYHSSPF